MVGGDLDQDDPGAVGVLEVHLGQAPRPQGSVTGSRMTVTPAAASRACSARTSRTWIQIITEPRPGRARARRPRGIPAQGRRPPRDRPAGRTHGRRPGPAFAPTGE